MKKEYFEPTMRVANLRHTNHLLAGSDIDIYSKPGSNRWGDKSLGTFDGSDGNVKDVLTDDDYDDII